MHDLNNSLDNNVETFIISTAIQFACGINCVLFVYNYFIKEFVCSKHLQNKLYVEGNSNLLKTVLRDNVVIWT